MPVNNPPRVQDYDNAHLDLQTIEDVVNGGPSLVVLSRLGRSIPSLASVINDIGSIGERSEIIVANYDALKAVDFSAASDAILVLGRLQAGDGAGGVFRKVSGDQSAAVTADALEGIDVAPASDDTGASGVWRRQIAGNLVLAAWWGCRAGVDADMQPAIQAAVDFLERSNTGGEVLLPAGQIRVDDTIVISQSNIALVGSGSDATHGAGTNQVHKTVLYWGGSASASKAVVNVRTPYGASTQRRIGQSVRDIDIDARSLAGFGLQIDSIAKGRFQNVHSRHATSRQYNLICGVTGTDSPSGEALDIQLCEFVRCSFETRASGTFAATNAIGWWLGQSSNANANVSGNTFDMCNGVYVNGAGWKLDGADNNVFIKCSGFRAGGSGAVYTFDLSGSPSGSGGAYANTFINPGWDATYGFIYRACSGSQARSARTNYIIAYDQANGGGTPVAESNALLVYSGTTGLSLGFDNGPTGFANGMVSAGLNQGDRATDVPVWIRTANGKAITIKNNNSPWTIEHTPEATMRLRPDGFYGTLEVWAPINMYDGISDLRYNGSRVVGPRKTGWALATGTATRTTFATSTVTTQQLAERVKALLDDLHATAGHGLIGA